MSIASFAFFIFLGAAWFAWALSPPGWRLRMLVVSSAVFYASYLDPVMPVAAAIATAATFMCGRGIARGRRKRLILIVGISANLAVLAVWKYLPSLGSSLPLRVAVAVGVSYYCLQAISYLVDVYLEVSEAEGDFEKFLLYMLFFPKVVQGPIERAHDFLSQLDGRGPDYEDFRRGVLLFAWGLFLKAVIADRLALYVGSVYGDVATYRGLPLLLGTYAYAFQLYFDFSGYTKMAQGAALLFRIRLRDNFNAPYLATSVAEFWRRWHMSFSSWLMDYLFRPVQMEFRALGRAASVIALLVTFALSGLWHGATAGFLVWGLLHGIYLSVGHLLPKSATRAIRNIPAPVRIFWTFNLVCFAWVFFRSDSAGMAVRIIAGMFDGLNLPALAALAQLHRKTNLLIVGAGLAVTAVVRLAGGRWRIEDFFRAPPAVRWGAYHALGICLLLFPVDGGGSFLYAQF